MEASKSNFRQYFWVGFIEIGELVVFIIKGFNIRGKLRNSIFGNILIALHKEISLILRSEKVVFIIKGLILLIGFRVP